MVNGSGRKRPLLLARMAAFVALGIVSGLMLSGVPNVELVTAVCFASGFLLGPFAGIVTGALTESLFAGFHPMGSSMGFLLMAQVVGMSLAGLLGGIASILCLKSNRRMATSVVVVSGVVSTMFFDFVTNLAYPLAAGFSVSQLFVALAAGVPFAVVHLASNFLVFLVVVAPLLPRLQRVLAPS